MSESSSLPCVGIVGLGLIGGSLAVALRRAGVASVTAWDSDPGALEAGLAQGVIDAAAADLPALLAAADIAVLAAPTLACEALLLQMLREPGRARCITDVASVKGPLCAAAASLGTSAAARYVPGHPIAGSERSGVDHADGDLFRGYRVILTPDGTTDRAALAEVRALWEAAGARVSCMGVREHDAVLAATSHLPHVLAYALVAALADAPQREDIFRYAAGGFRDFTRIASSDPVMWRDIALANRDALLSSLDDFEDHLARLRRAIEGADGAAIEAVFRVAKQARDGFAAELLEREKLAAARRSRGRDADKAGKLA